MPVTPAGTTISTLADLIDGGYTMHFTCRNRDCLRGTFQVDLQVLADRYGRDASYIRGETKIRIKCALCGRSCRDGIIIPRR